MGDDSGIDDRTRTYSGPKRGPKRDPLCPETRRPGQTVPQETRGGFRTGRSFETSLDWTERSRSLKGIRLSLVQEEKVEQYFVLPTKRS